MKTTDNGYGHTTLSLWSGGFTVEADSLADCLRVVSAHQLASRDTGPLMIHGHRTDHGRAAIIVRLAQPRIPYTPTADPLAGAVGVAIRATVAADAVITPSMVPRG
jgi:hypothetical protein